MTRCFLILLVLFACNAFGQRPKSYLYLQNDRTEKIKKINLANSHMLSFSIDSNDANYQSNLTRHSYTAERCRFGTDSVRFYLGEVNYFYWMHSKNRDTFDTRNFYFDYDTSVTLSYIDPSCGFNRYLSWQSKIGRGLFITGCGIVYAALVNAFFVAPLRGMNQGSFNGYSTQRLWQGELYSGFGLAAGLPLMFIFDYKDYYFQNESGVFDTWTVVNGN